MSMEPQSYVQRMRMAKATVWAERGPKDDITNQRKHKIPSSSKKGRFGMKIFNGQENKAPKTKLRLYAAPQHTTLVPRLSASEANDVDDFDNFTSAAPLSLTEKRTSNSPSLPRSSLHLTPSRNNSFTERSTHNGYNNGFGNNVNGNGTNGTNGTSESPVAKPKRMDSVASSGAASSMRDLDDLYPHRRTHSQSQLTPHPSTFATSRSGSPTQLQQYTAHHIVSDSDDEEVGVGVEYRPKLFIANADVSDSD